MGRGFILLPVPVEQEDYELLCKNIIEEIRETDRDTFKMCKFVTLNHSLGNLLWRFRLYGNGVQLLDLISDYCVDSSMSRQRQHPLELFSDDINVNLVQVSIRVNHLQVSWFEVCSQFALHIVQDSKEADRVSV